MGRKNGHHFSPDPETARILKFPVASPQATDGALHQGAPTLQGGLSPQPSLPWALAAMILLAGFAILGALGMTLASSQIFRHDQSATTDATYALVSAMLCLIGAAGCALRSARVKEPTELSGWASGDAAGETTSRGGSSRHSSKM